MKQNFEGLTYEEILKTQNDVLEKIPWINTEELSMKRNNRRRTANQPDSESLRPREAGNEAENSALGDGFHVVLQGYIDPHSGRLTSLKIKNQGMEIRGITSEKGHFSFEGVVETPRVTQLLQRITE